MQLILASVLSQLFLVVLLLGGAQSVFQFANYPLIPQVKTGDHKLLMTSITGPNSSSYVQNFAQNFTHTPIVAVSIRDMQISGTSSSGSVDYTCKIFSISTSQFTNNLTLTGNNTFSSLYYMYIGIDTTTVKDTYFYSPTTNLTSQYNDTNGVVGLFNQSTANLTDYAHAVVVALPMSFGMNTTHQFSFFVSASMISLNVSQVNITSNSKLYRMELTIIVVDKTDFQSTETYFIDVGTEKTYQSGALLTSNFNTPSFNYFNYVLGLAEFRVDLSQDINFFLYTNNSILSFTSFKYLSYFAIQWRWRQCSGGVGYYFVLQQQLCYQTQCPTGYAAANTSMDYCVKCSYTCVTCAINGSCLTCFNSSFTTNRQLLNNTTCNCTVGFYQNGSSICPQCSYTCTTCTNSSTLCLSCQTTTRNLINNSCPCLSGFFQQINSTKCPACDYTCLTCTGTSTNCTSCDQTNNFRFYDSTRNTCTCKTGYQDNGVAKCVTSTLVCTLPCQTCNTTATNCLSCLGNRTLTTNNTCPCKNGFAATNDSSPCYEICGNGQMITNSTKQCDDGNSIAGDGCSATCTIQSNFVCDNSVMPSVCTSTNGYSFSTQSIAKDQASNTLTVVLTIDPTPPSSSVPSLINLQDSLSIISYSLNQSTLTLNLNLLKTLDNSSQLKVQLSKINSTATVSLASTSSVSLMPYVDSYYTLQNVEIILVWTYIGALWLLSAYRIVTEPTLISQVCQVFVYTSLAWIGVEGQQKPMLLFVPIKNLKYIFGYNIQLSNNSLFSVCNLSFAYLIIPLLIFVFMLVIGKKRPGFSSARIKRFVLYDLSYAWIVVNGFLLAYGTSLSVTNQDSLTLVDIAGIIVFVLYLVVMAVASIRSFFRGQDVQQINPTLQYTKKNLFKQKIYPVYLLLSIIMSFAYLVLQKYTQINPLFMIAFFLVMMVVFGVGNVFINKVRNLLNLINLLLIYCCYLLINQISTATWTGFVVIALLFVQLATNFVIMYFQKNNLRVDPDDDLLKDKVKAQTNFDQNPQNHHENSDRGVIQLEEHVGAFMIYQPATPKKDQLNELLIPQPQRNQNALSILTKPFDVRPDRERVTQMRQALNQYLLTSPKYNAETDFKKDQPQELLDISKKQVEMNQF